MQTGMQTLRTHKTPLSQFNHNHQRDRSQASGRVSKDPDATSALPKSAPGGRSTWPWWGSSRSCSLGCWQTDMHDKCCANLSEWKSSSGPGTTPSLTPMRSGGTCSATNNCPLLLCTNPWQTSFRQKKVKRGLVPAPSGPHLSPIRDMFLSVMNRLATCCQAQH